jgi:hypothetical protein
MMKSLVGTEEGFKAYLLSFKGTVHVKSSTEISTET